jgi:hypothetical protein
LLKKYKKPYFSFEFLLNFLFFLREICFVTRVFCLFKRGKLQDLPIHEADNTAT